MTPVRLLVGAAQLRASLPPQAVAALDDMVAGVSAAPATLGRVFPAVARRTARGPLAGSPHRTEDAARVELVAAASASWGPADLLEELRAVYRHGDADEKRAVLLALGGVEDPAVDGSEVLLDALRSNDVRLVAAAMGAHAARLPVHDWRHGVLKCLFVGVPLHEVADLADRTDAELVAMVRRFAAERDAAGRPVPADASALIHTTPRET